MPKLRFKAKDFGTELAGKLCTGKEAEQHGVKGQVVVVLKELEGQYRRYFSNGFLRRGIIEAKMGTYYVYTNGTAPTGDNIRGWLLKEIGDKYARCTLSSNEVKDKDEDKDKKK